MTDNGKKSDNIFHIMFSLFVLKLHARHNASLTKQVVPTNQRKLYL